MSLEEILKIEKRSSHEDLFVIHLFKDGNWWRAYEWSAFLCSIFPAENKLSIVKRMFNKIEIPIAVTGLQLRSFKKFFPSLNEPTSIQDSHIIFDLSKLIKLDIDSSQYEDKLHKFKETLKLQNPIKQPPISKHTGITEVNSIDDILREILQYRIEEHSFIEQTQFLSAVKKQIANFTKFQ